MAQLRLFVAFRLLLMTLMGVGLVHAQETERLGPQVNTIYDEREPIISPDGKTMYFWRKLAPENMAGSNDHGDIWFTIQLGSGQWAPAKRMGIPLNSPGHDFVWQVSEHNDTLWMAQVPQGRRSVPGMAYATRSSYGGWNRPVPLTVQGLVSRGDCKDFFLTPNKILLFPNQGADTYGESDLYVSFPLGPTQWSAPTNLGPIVNTYGDEDAPYLSADGKTLFFNSNGHGGFGDHDIFMTTRLDDSWTNWSEPVNLGAPINTPGYEYDFRLTPDEQYAYWGSETNTYGKGDIFRLQLASCQIDVYPQGDHTLCMGDTLWLEAGFSFFPGVSYQWYKDGEPIPGAIYRNYGVSSSGVYELEKKMGTCVVRSHPQRIDIRAIPEISLSTPAEFLCEGDSLLLWSGRREGFTYQWKMNGLDIYGATNPGYWATGPGAYSVVLSNGECVFETDPMTLDQIPTPEIYLSGDILPTSASSLPKWLWTNHAPELKGDISLYDIGSDPQGNMYILSILQDGTRNYEYLTKFFSEGPMHYQELTSSVAQQGRRFISVDPAGNTWVARDYPFLSKFSRSGKKVWELEADIGKINGVGTDAVGNVYTYGRFQKTITLGDELLVPANRGSIFVAKHSPQGELLWAQTFPVDGASARFGNALYIDQSGNLFIAGSFNGIANFREKVLRAPLRGESYFVAKFDTRGNFHWAEPLTVNTDPEEVMDFTADKMGNSYLLLDTELVSLGEDGKKRYEVSLNYKKRPKQIRMAAQEDQVYLMGYREKDREYFVNMVSTQGRMFNLWEGGKGERDASHSYTLGMAHSGEILIAGLSEGGDLPSTTLAPSRNAPFFAAKFGRPKVRPVNTPLSLCDISPIYLLAREVKGVQYQWLRNGDPFSLGASPMLEVTEPGDYQVRILGGSCENVSAIQQVVANCEDGPYYPPVVAEKPVEATPEPEPVIAPPVDPYEKDAPELARTPDGAPVTLDNREVVKQGAVSIRNTTVTLSLWDHEVFDQDTVSLNINGEWVLKDYCLLPEKKILNYTFDSNNPNNFIILYANNLGQKPPNTASLMIDDGIRKRTVRLRSTLEDCGTIQIKLP